MIRVAVVEDEESLATMIQLNLEMEGFDVTHFNNGLDAYSGLREGRLFDLYVLDVMLPGMNGVDLCKKIRQVSSAPILFLSAKGTTSDRIEGLKAGGNDYLPKPFDLEELLLRVRILTNSKKAHTEDELTFGPWVVNYRSFEARNSVDGTLIQLTRKEVDLLRLFQENEGEVIPRTEILDNVWGKDQYPTTRTVDNFILQLRKYFEENPREPAHFHSIRGVGYRFTR